MNDQCPPCTPDAMRAKKYRERVKHGVQVVSIEVDQQMIENLLVKRVLEVDRCGDKVAIARAIGWVLRDAS